jgi:spermidine synthase
VDAPAARALPWPVAGALVFVTSGCVLVLEILAGRLLAPYVGVTLQTYTGVIGTVLAGIALGTWWGGTLSDRHEPRRLIGPLVVGGGATALATVPLVRVLGDGLRGGGAGAIVVLSAVGFFAPAALLSAVTPAVVKLRLRSLADTGSVVGTLSALSTAGAIAGTFVAGFVLVAAASVTTLIVTIGATLVALGLLLWWRLRGIGVAALAGVLAVGGGGVALALTVGRPCDVETTYYCAIVEVDPEESAGRVLVLDDLRHSYVHLDDPTHIEFRYLRVVVDAIDATWPTGTPIDALHIGGGGFTLPRWLEATHPGSRSLVLELDPGIVDVARDRLGLITGPDLAVETGDARLGIADAGTDEYDLVMGDAFGGRSVPWHLTTIEFVREVDRVLRDDGVYVVNLIDGPPLRFARAEAATLARSFAHVAVIAPPSALDGSTSGNIVLVASHQELALDDLARRVDANGDDDALIGTADLDGFVGGAEVLRDDFAPVDQYLGGSS